MRDIRLWRFRLAQIDTEGMRSRRISAVYMVCGGAIVTLF